MMTSQVFFKLIHQLFQKGGSWASLLSKFRGFVYGLGGSVNEDFYMEDYKQMTI